MSDEKKLHSICDSDGEITGAPLAKEHPILRQPPEQVEDILASELFSDATLRDIEASRIEKLKNPQTIPTPKEKRQYTRAQHYINGEVAGFLRDSKKSKPEPSEEEYLKSFMRQIWLKQTSIITLRNERYIDSFIQDLGLLLQVHPKILHTYTDTYGSQEFASSYELDPTKITQTTNSEIFFLLDYVWEIHSGSNSRGQKSYIDQYTLMMKLFYNIEDDVQINMDEYMRKQLVYIYQIQNMPDFFRDGYTQFRNQLIEKYGITYINTLKGDVRHQNNPNIEFSDEFIDNPEIALFYFIEQIFSGTFSHLDHISLTALIDQYRFKNLPKNLYFLFVTTLTIIHEEIGYQCIVANFHNFPPYSWIFLIQALLYAEEREYIVEDLLNAYGAVHLIDIFTKQYKDQDIEPELQNLIIGGIGYLQYTIQASQSHSKEDMETLDALGGLTEDQYKQNLIAPKSDYIYEETLDQLSSFYIDTLRIEQGLELVEKKLLSKIKSEKNNDADFGYKLSKELMLLICGYKQMGNKKKVNQWIQFGMQEGYDMKNIKYDTTELSRYAFDKPTVVH